MMMMIWVPPQDSLSPKATADTAHSRHCQHSGRVRLTGEEVSAATQIPEGGLKVPVASQLPEVGLKVPVASQLPEGGSRVPAAS